MSTYNVKLFTTVESYKDWAVKQDVNKIKIVNVFNTNNNIIITYINNKTLND